MISNETSEYGKRVMTALLGVDQLYRSESADVDGLAVLNMDHKGEYPPESFGSYHEARECFEILKNDAINLPEKDRQVYYDQLCHSTLAFIKWRDRGLEFNSQLSDFLHIPVQPASENELDDLRKKMQALLNQMDYHGDLKTQCTAWEEKNRVPSDEISEILENLLSEAWDHTEKLLIKIPAPKSDGMQVNTVSGVSFNARCNYIERTVELNIDPILTLPGLKHLVVHECYPGHYLQFKMRETMYQKGLAPADVLLSIVNSASSSVFEGIADVGMKMINWIETDDDRFLSLMNRYRAGIGTGAAWRLHSLGWSEKEVFDWLNSQSLVGGEGWVKNRMGFIAAPARAVLIWSYWWGKKVVEPVWDRIPAKHRPEFLRFLYGRMHSNKTVTMFTGE